MKPKQPTPAQATVISAAKQGLVQRRRYESHSIGGITMTWRWVNLATHTAVPERVIFAIEKNGWGKVERGELREGAPVDDPLMIAMGNWRLPDRLVVEAPKEQP